MSSRGSGTTCCRTVTLTWWRSVVLPSLRWYNSGGIGEEVFKDPSIAGGVSGKDWRNQYSSSPPSVLSLPPARHRPSDPTQCYGLPSVSPADATHLLVTPSTLAHARLTPHLLLFLASLCSSYSSSAWFLSPSSLSSYIIFFSFISRVMVVFQNTFTHAYSANG